MKAILLFGKSRSGKTTTIASVYKELIEMGAKIHKARGDDTDFEAILIYKGKKIGFHSMGDVLKNVEGAIRRFKTYGCDILICACNDKFITWEKRIGKHIAERVTKNARNNIDNNRCRDEIIVHIQRMVSE